MSEPGGFLRSSFLSPTPSSAASSTVALPTLPTPRQTPLKSGKGKESSFIDYVDRKLLSISRRYEKRFNKDLEDEKMSDKSGQGYKSFDEMAKDLANIMDAVWVSGTPSLQTPYLLTIALMTCNDMISFPFDPRSTFHLLHKLDLAFYSLLQGANPETGETLPGFGGGRGGLSVTEKVRIKGLVERTRVAVVEVAGKEGSVTDSGIEMQTNDEYTTDNDDDDIHDEGISQALRVEGNHGRWEMEVARVYEKTIVELGIVLDSGMGVSE